MLYYPNYMQRHILIYAIFILAMLVLNILVLVTPVLAFQGNAIANTLYHDVLSYLCHQKISRSHCLFQGAEGFYIGDCTPQEGEYTFDNPRQISIIQEGNLGYKFPVCARDVAIYLAMLLVGLTYPFFFRLDSREFPDPLYLIISLIPIGADGGLQFISDMGIHLPIIGMYESTNLARLVTGFIAGAVVTIYLLPILNQIISKKNTKKKK